MMNNLKCHVLYLEKYTYMVEVEFYDIMIM